MKNDSARKKVFRRLFLSFMAICTMAVNVVQAQNITLNLGKCTVQEAVTALNQKEGYSISFNTDDVDPKKEIQVNVKDATLTEVLDLIFSGQDVTYTIDGKRIAVMKKGFATPEILYCQAVLRTARGSRLSGLQY